MVLVAGHDEQGVRQPVEVGEDGRPDGLVAGQAGGLALRPSAGEARLLRCRNLRQVATGDKGTFDMKTEILTLSGKEVVLSEGSNVLTGCKLTVDMKSGLAQVEGCGGRVKGLFQPGSQSQ